MTKPRLWPGAFSLIYRLIVAIGVKLIGNFDLLCFDEVGRFWHLTRSRVRGHSTSSHFELQPVSRAAINSRATCPLERDIYLSATCTVIDILAWPAPQ